MKRGLRLFLVSVLLGLPLFGWAFGEGAQPASVRSVLEKLERWDVEEAHREVQILLEKEPRNADLLEAASSVSFHRGDYEEALRLMRSALEYGGEEERRKGLSLFIEETIGATKPLKRFESPHFILFLDEKRDGILLDYLKDALERTYDAMADRYGFRPREKIRVEVFPDSKAFYFASSLSARDIETGAVGLAKFNKLMILSPSALVHGYRWLDSISHEYMHYLIVKMTEDRAPIWFHEGLAKYEETRWRGEEPSLSPLLETLLARAIERQHFISFDRMEPSLVKLPSPEDVQLAYAEAASAISFIVERVGHEGLREIMRQMAREEPKGAKASIQRVLGMDFERFEREWKTYLASKGFKERKGVTLRRYKLKEGKADEERMEMEEIKSLVARNRAHLGDRLRERGRRGAALLEYRRALSEAPDTVVIMTRLSSILMEMDRFEEALEQLTTAKTISPDHPTLYTYLGKIHLKLGNLKSAKKAFESSIQINPFNPEIHRGLSKVFEQLGDDAMAAKEAAIADRLEKR